MATQSTNILILGAGIGGYEIFRQLEKKLRHSKNKKKITIVDRNNYFTFAPLLHEVASGAVEPIHATLPLREVVYQTPHQFFQAEIQKIDPTTKTVQTSAGDITYDYCVMALGCGVNYYGVPGAKEFSYTVRTLPAAMNLRRAIIHKIEQSDTEIALTVVGGGYTGVEVIGQLAHLVDHDLKKLYPEKHIHLSLIQNAPSLVPALPVKAQKIIDKRLKKMNVTVLCNDAVKEVRKNSVVLNSGEQPSDFTIWCAGNFDDMTQLLPSDYCVKGRVPVTHFLNHEHSSTLYGVGDLIIASNVGEKNFYPQLAEAAYKEADYVAQHILATMRGKTLRPFNFHSVGTLMPIGDGFGLVIIGQMVFSGWVAWWIRRTVYVFFLPGWLHKIRLMFDWSLRLISFRYIVDIEGEQK